MGYFTINLPNNIEGEVRWGKVFKRENAFLNLLVPWRKSIEESKTGYIVKLKSAFVNVTEYRLFRTKEGTWSQDADGKVQLEGGTELAIKRAIEEYEKASM